MDQHPVPQNISSFQFKLFGNLTIRQFMMLVPPLVIAGIIFFSGIAPIIRYPVAGIIGFVAFIVAVVPIQGRPFDKWIIAFIRAVFSPTQRIWIKGEQIPEFLSIVITPPPVEEKASEQVTFKSRERLIAYLKSLPKDNASPLDVREQMAVQGLNLGPEKTGVGQLPPPIWPMASVEKVPQIVVGEGLPQVAQSDRAIAAAKEIQKEFELREKAVGAKLKEEVQILPKLSRSAKPYVLEGIEEKLRERVKKPKIAALFRNHLASETNFSVSNIFSVKGPNNRVRLVQGVGKTRVRKLHFAPPENFDLSRLPVRGEGRFEISKELAKRFHFEDDSPDVVLANQANATVASVTIDTSQKAKEIERVLPKAAKIAEQKSGVIKQVEPVKIAPQVSGQDYSKFSTSNTKQMQETVSSQTVQIIPLTSAPNVLSGLITDNRGLPVEAAVLVVRDSSGVPVRALKTNKLGQFLSATPLRDGTYTIEIESETAKFAPTSVNLSGQILPPIGIRGEAISSG